MNPLSPPSVWCSSVGEPILVFKISNPAGLGDEPRLGLHSVLNLFVCCHITSQRNIVVLLPRVLEAFVAQFAQARCYPLAG